MHMIPVISQYVESKIIGIAPLLFSFARLLLFTRSGVTQTLSLFYRHIIIILKAIIDRPTCCYRVNPLLTHGNKGREFDENHKDERQVQRCLNQIRFTIQKLKLLQAALTLPESISSSTPLPPPTLLTTITAAEAAV